MAYNKTKHLEAAQKNLNQGKIAQATQEYLQILKHEPKDQITLMTVGDLYVRQGETSQALEYFERLAQIFLADGFVTKAIAIYKKIAKLAPEQSHPVERLAELYLQQGILSEARPIYLQLADLHQRAGRRPEAAALLRKLLQAEPDNLRVQTRFAELSAAMGNAAEAASAYSTASEQLHKRGDHAEAVKYADRALKIVPNDTGALSIKAQALSAAGQQSVAISLLEAVPELEKDSQPVRLLLDFYLEAGETTRAGELARRVFANDSKNFSPAHHVALTLLEKRDGPGALALLGLVRESMTNAGEHESLARTLSRAAELMPGRVEPRQWLVDVYGHASDSFHLPDALVDLGKAFEAAGALEKALQAYEQLLDRDPENDSVRRECERLRRSTGLPGPAEAEASAVSKENHQEDQEAKPAAEAKPARPVLDQETQALVTQALTDVDLFSSYGLTQKAIDLLETVLQRVPRHTVALERLFDLYLGLANDGRTAQLAALIDEVHREQGDTVSAERFAKLRQRLQRTAETPGQESSPAAPAAAAPTSPATAAPANQAAPAGAATPASLPAEFSLPVDSAPAAPAEEPSPEPSDPLKESAAWTDLGDSEEIATEGAVHEIDLSEEWEALALELDQGTPAAEAIDEPVAQAEASPRAEPPVAAALELDQGTPAAEAIDEPVAPVQASPEAEPPVAAAPAPEAETPAVVPEVVAEEAPEAAAPEETSAPEPLEYVLELEAAPAAENPAAQDLDSEGFLQSLSTELDAVEPETAAAIASRANGEPHGEPAQTAAASSGPLGEVFDEFRSELGDTAEESEDLEAHYNLGVAYREMGLIEEAISEFQKVAKASGNGRPFRYSLQCCTLLGMAFMDKGQPAIAADWYERALQLPELDQETTLALRYDLGVAQELAGDMASARKSFSQVYGMNIDYRDVAERLASLAKES